jgi:hypothetical protein
MAGKNHLNHHQEAKERGKGRDWVPTFPFKTTPPMAERPPTRPHISKFPLPPNGTTKYSKSFLLAFCNKQYLVIVSSHTSMVPLSMYNFYVSGKKNKNNLKL